MSIGIFQAQPGGVARSALLKVRIASELRRLIVVHALQRRVEDEANAALRGALGEVLVLAGHAKALIEQADALEIGARQRQVPRGRHRHLVQAWFEPATEPELLEVALEAIQESPEGSLRERP